jgi:hypothetical protein
VALAAPAGSADGLATGAVFEPASQSWSQATRSDLGAQAQAYTVEDPKKWGQ